MAINIIATQLDYLLIKESEFNSFSGPFGEVTNPMFYCLFED
jgi:hypothetical protein